MIGRWIGAVAGALVAAYLIWGLRSLIVPIAVGSLLAYVCYPLVARLERYRLTRGLAIGLLVLGFFSAALILTIRIRAGVPSEIGTLDFKTRALHKLNERYESLMGLDVSPRGNRLYQFGRDDLDPVVDRINSLLALTSEERSRFLEAHSAGHLHRRHPAVGPRSDPFQPRRSECAQVYRRARPLHRFELQPRLGDRPARAGVLYGVRRPQCIERVQQFIQLRATTDERGACGLILLRRPPDAEPGQQPTAADDVDAGELAAQLRGRIPGGDEHAAAQPRLRGHGRGDGKRDERVEAGAELLGNRLSARITHRRMDRGEQAVADPEAVGAELFGRRREAGQLSDIQVGGLSELRNRESQHDRQASA